MKKLIVELGLEGPYIRNTVNILRQLLQDGKVFQPSPKLEMTGNGEYEQKIARYIYLHETPQHPLIQPARGLIQNLVIVVGGSDDPEIETAESLEQFFEKALAYAELTELAYQTAVAEIQKTTPSIISISRDHARHAKRRVVGAHRFRPFWPQPQHQ